MIPYDDLVVALAAWRARQGLPVAHPPTAAAPPQPPPAHGRAAPPAAPRPTPARAVIAEAGDFEDSALVEDAGYDTGDDYVMQLGEPGEPTPIGSPADAAPASRRDKRW